MTRTPHASPRTAPSTFHADRGGPSAAGNTGTASGAAPGIGPPRLPHPQALRLRPPLAARLTAAAAGARAPVPGERDEQRLAEAIRSEVFGALDPAQRMRLARMYPDLIPHLDENERRQITDAAAARIRDWYRAQADRKAVRAAARTPWRDESTFYWGNRATLRATSPQAIARAFRIYHSVEPLALMDAPAILHSLRHPQEAALAHVIFGLRNLPWNLYNPGLYTGVHDMQMNEFWLLGLCHFQRPAVLTVGLDDRTVVRGRAWRSGDAAVQCTDRSLAAYPREILGLLQADHYRVADAIFPVQILEPTASARRAVHADLRTAGGMPKPELIRRLRALGVDTASLSSEDRPWPRRTPRISDFAGLHAAARLQQILPDADAIAARAATIAHIARARPQQHLHATDAQPMLAYRTTMSQLRRQLGLMDAATTGAEVGEEEARVYLDTLALLDGAGKHLWQAGPPWPVSQGTEEWDWIRTMLAELYALVQDLQARLAGPR